MKPNVTISLCYRGNGAVPMQQQPPKANTLKLPYVQDIPAVAKSNSSRSVNSSESSSMAADSYISSLDKNDRGLPEVNQPIQILPYVRQGQEEQKHSPNQSENRRQAQSPHSATSSQRHQREVSKMPYVDEAKRSIEREQSPLMSPSQLPANRQPEEGRAPNPRPMLPDSYFEWNRESYDEYNSDVDQQPQLWFKQNQPGMPISTVHAALS